MANRYISNDNATEYENRMVVLRMIVTGVILALILLFGILSCDSNACAEDDVVPLNAERETLSGIETYPHIIDDALDEDFEPDDLVTLVGVPNGENIRLRKKAAAAYLSLHEAMAADGLSMIPIEGYRSYASASDIYMQKIDALMKDGDSYDEAVNDLRTDADAPGYDEHQLGLTVDVSTDNTRQDDLYSLPQGTWLQKNCWKYGFIFRYTEKKHTETGKNARPWEMRYVGEFEAEYITKNGLCLEEYNGFCREECPDSEMEGIE